MREELIDEKGSVVMLIALLIIRLGAKNIWTPILILLDANLDPELRAEIEEKISAVDGVKGVGDVKIRQSGPYKMVEYNIATSPSSSVYKAHELADCHAESEFYRYLQGRGRCNRTRDDSDLLQRRNRADHSAASGRGVGNRKTKADSRSE